VVTKPTLNFAPLLFHPAVLWGGRMELKGGKVENIFQTAQKKQHEACCY